MGFFGIFSLVAVLLMSSFVLIDSSLSGLRIIDDSAMDSFVGGSWTQSLMAATSVLPFLSVAPMVNVAPSFFVAPMLRSSSSSFNFFANRDSFNGSNNLLILG